MHQDSASVSKFGLISFRFAFIYFLIYFNPLVYFNAVPGFYWIQQLVTIPFDALTFFLNDQLFHIRPQLNQMGGGSGDTSFAWAQAATFLTVAGLGTVVWSVVDWRKQRYPILHYWLCLILRFTLVGVAFSYGFLKVLAMQMYFPNISQLATPLGDYLPMRLSWLFIGYSEPYQIFSGIAEVLVALLLVWRRTALLGALLSVGVFANVVMLNLSFDIPVKLYSINLLIASMFLVWQERERLFAFFIQNKTVLPSCLFEKQMIEPWQKTGRFMLKAVFLLASFGYTTYNYTNYFNQYHADFTKVLEPINPGIYYVELFVKNGDTIPESMADTLRWRDVIFDYNGEGSIAANDSSLRMRYGRAYFSYKLDSLGEQMEWRMSTWDSFPVMSFAMDIPADDRMILSGTQGKDSLHVVLKKLKRHFPLTERQFHWISESNR